MEDPQIHQTAKPALLRAPVRADFVAALRAGWGDMRAAPGVGLFFAAVYFLAGWGIAWVTWLSGHTFWLILAVMGFPLIGSLAALGFYDVSRRRAAGQSVALREVATSVWVERAGQVPLLAVAIIMMLLFWFFLGHMIFAVFLGLEPMVNISSSLEVLLTQEGLSMLAVGTGVGAVFAFVIYGITIFGLPMLVDRDVDCITASIASMQAVTASPLAFAGWAALIVGATVVAMLPGFLGLFLVLPLFGHATWHLYARLSDGG